MSQAIWGSTVRNTVRRLKLSAFLVHVSSKTEGSHLSNLSQERVFFRKMIILIRSNLSASCWERNWEIPYLLSSSFLGAQGARG